VGTKQQFNCPQGLDSEDLKYDEASHRGSLPRNSARPQTFHDLFLDRPAAALGKISLPVNSPIISHPVHGKYRCWTCLQEFDTNF